MKKGKKIVTYEEGGSNGLSGEDQLSSVALILTCTTSGVDPIEAWCVPIQSEEVPLCVSSDTMGAALLCTESMMLSKGGFNPLLILTKMETDVIFIEVFSISRNPLTAESCTRTSLEINDDDEIYEAPTMAMGSSPPILCLCWKSHIVIIIRERGLLISFKYDSNDLTLSFKHKFDRYVVDAGMQSDEIGCDSSVKVCVLLSEPGKKDGRIVKITLK